MEGFCQRSFQQYGCPGYSQTAGVVNHHKWCYWAKKKIRACLVLTGGVVAGHQKIHISTKVTSAVTLDVLSHSGLKETILVDLWLLKKGFVCCTNSIPFKGEKELRDPNGEMLFRIQQSLMMLADPAETHRCIPAFREMHHIAAIPTCQRSQMDSRVSSVKHQRCCEYLNVDLEDSLVHRWIQRRRD